MRGCVGRRGISAFGLVAVFFLLGTICVLESDQPVNANVGPLEPTSAADLAGDEQIAALLGPVRHARIGALIPDLEQACVPAIGASEAIPAGATPAKAALTEAIATVRQSEVGAWLLREAARRQVIICLDQATELEAYYRARMRLIGLSATLGAPRRVVFLAHELAHMPQHPRFSNDRRFAPHDMILLHRAREATAEAIATRVLWQLRQQGHGAPWREKLNTAYGDIAGAFIATIELGGPTAERELRATRAAFDRWFEAPWRLRVYDRLILQHLARIAQDEFGLVPPSRWLSDPFLRGIAWYGHETFLRPGGDHRLTDAFYARDLTPNNATFLQAILDEADWHRLTLAGASEIGDALHGSRNRSWPTQPPDWTHATPLEARR